MYTDIHEFIQDLTQSVKSIEQIKDPIKRLNLLRSVECAKEHEQLINGGWVLSYTYIYKAIVFAKHEITELFNE